uniref:Basigin n=1 Tax=Schistocephalus solidus TaxID=70667 RepID=A0A0X3PF15_SCHSO
MTFLLKVALLLSAVVIVSAITVDVQKPEEILPTYTSLLQYENIEFPKRNRNSSVHLVLSYVVTGLQGPDVSLTWQLNGEVLTLQDQSSRATLYAVTNYDTASRKESVDLHLKDSGILPGEYTLTATQSGASATGKASVKSAPILPVYSKPKRVLQGDPLRLSCKVSAWPVPPNVKWSFHHIDVAQSDDKTAINNAFLHLKPLDLDALQWENVKYTTEDDVQSDTLRFTELDPKHNGLYACKVSNALGEDVTFLLVDVKDRWAALWPFIGIVIEVTVLVAAILLYERHQMRSKPPTANNANVDSASPNGAASGVNERTSRTEEVRLRNAAKA